MTLHWVFAWVLVLSSISESLFSFFFGRFCLTLCQIGQQIPSIIQVNCSSFSMLYHGTLPSRFSTLRHIWSCELYKDGRLIIWYILTRVFILEIHWFLTRSQLDKCALDFRMKIILYQKKNSQRRWKKKHANNVSNWQQTQFCVLVKYSPNASKYTQNCSPNKNINENQTRADSLAPATIL